MVDPSLDAIAHALIDELMALHPLARRPTLEWRRYRTTAGMAFVKQNRIALSVALITDKDRLRETLVHEYAHLLAAHRHGRRAQAHGPAWVQAMRDLGAVPTVRHKYACDRNKPRQEVHYKCMRCHTILRRRRRLPRRRVYVHVNCGGKLIFEQAIRITTDGTAA